MIIFDLDGTLADCEHRRHFVDPYKQPVKVGCTISLDLTTGKTYSDIPRFKPDWKSFYEDCDKDNIIEHVKIIINKFHGYDYYHPIDDVHIWSGRCESVRKKTETWLNDNGITYCELKMRAIGDYTPDDQLKERWLDEAIDQGKKIDFVFDDRKKVVRMWRRRGIFVFDVNQTGDEF